MSLEWPRISQQRRRFLNQATNSYHSSLTSEAREYLMSRGFTDEVVAEYQLGYVADPMPGHEPAKGFLSIPYRSHSGPTAIRFRRLGDGEGKRWWAEKGRPDPLFNVMALHRPEPYIAICEGQTDTITMDGLVGVPAVGISGAGKWVDHWARLFEDYETVFLCLDPDKAGENALEKIVTRLSDNAKPVHLDADINTVFLSEGSEAIREAMGL